MSFRVDPLKGTCITLIHMFDIQFLQVIFPMCIYHFMEYHAYLLIITFPLLFQQVNGFILNNCANGPEISI